MSFDKSCQSYLDYAREKYVDALFLVENEAQQAEAIGQLLADVMDATEQSDVGNAVVKAFYAFTGEVNRYAEASRAFESVARDHCNIFKELAKK